MTEAIRADVRKKIEGRLASIEREHDVTIFFACESGSRAWDFASPDSDYDVRFLYVHKRNWYLALRPDRDVIETPIEGVYDVNGWDLRKALLLGAKSNPVLFEWLASPIRYLERPLSEKFRSVVAECHDPARAYQHYLSMARDQVRAFLSEPEVLHKKYFYVLRPLLACQFLLDRGTAIPMRFGDLLDAVGAPQPVLQAISSLLAAKRSGGEAERAPRVAVLDQWIAEKTDMLGKRQPTSRREPDFQRLERFFLSAIGG